MTDSVNTMDGFIANVDEIVATFQEIKGAALLTQGISTLGQSLRLVWEKTKAEHEAELQAAYEDGFKAAQSEVQNV